MDKRLLSMGLIQLKKIINNPSHYWSSWKNITISEDEMQVTATLRGSFWQGAKGSIILQTWKK